MAGLAQNKKVIGLAVGIVALAGISWGSIHHNASRAEYARVCKSNSTGRRVEDQDCENDTNSSGYTSSAHWYYTSNSRDSSKTAQEGDQRLPAIGQSLNGGSDTKPSEGTIYTGLPKEGGTFTDTYKSALAYEKVSQGKTTKSGSGGSSAARGGFGFGHSTGGGHGG